MKTFLISDTHFGHKNILSFKDKEGHLIREFSCIEDHDEFLIEKWNSVVGIQDKVYHLGDVAICKTDRFRSIMRRLNGRKVLIKGNHDQLKPSVYLEYFKDIRGYHLLDKFVLSHVPVHTDSISRFRGNIHGHVHLNTLPDTRYFNVSVERINYTPINFEEIRENEQWK